MKFKGTPKYQVKSIFELSGILQFGQSKHNAKATAKTRGAKGPTEYAQITGVFSHNTYRAYFKTCVELMQYASEVHGIKKANQLTDEHVRAFLLGKSAVKLASFRRYTAALTKFDAALSNLLVRPPQWSTLLKEFREAAPVILDGEQPARAYRDPAGLVQRLDGDMRLIAELQWKAGLRVSEACQIKSHQLKGTTRDYKGRTVGILEIKGKGGKVRLTNMPLTTYNALRFRTAHGSLRVDPSNYRVHLRQAAYQSGQQYVGRGTHGIRWCYAQERMDELINNGMAYEVALTTVSKLMGHERASITLHYMREG